MELQPVIDNAWKAVISLIRNLDADSETKEANQRILNEVERLQSLWELHDKRVREVVGKQIMKTKSTIQLYEEAERTAQRNSNRNVREEPVNA